METYSPFIILGVFSVVAPLITGGVFSYFNEKHRRVEDKKMNAFLRHMHIESEKNTHETNRIIASSEKIHKDNVIFLRIVFERVDKPDPDFSV